MGLLDRRTVSVLITILVFAGLLGLVWLARFPIISFMFAVFVAYLLEPVIGRCQGWFHVSRGKSIAITKLAFFGGLLIFALTAGAKIIDPAQRLPSLLQNKKTGTIAWQVGEQYGWSAGTERRIQ